MSERKHWSTYFLDIAEQVSTRSTCARKHVGCVIVLGKRVVATGYNGSIAGEPHCDEVGHDLQDVIAPDGSRAPNCVRTVHAEANALAQAARFGVRLEGGTAYVNTYPCWPCFRLLANAGITAVIFRDGYRIDPRVHDASARLGIKVEGPGCYFCGGPGLFDETSRRLLCPDHLTREASEVPYAALIESELARFGLCSTGSDPEIVRTVSRLMLQARGGGAT